MSDNVIAFGKPRVTDQEHKPLLKNPHLVTVMSPIAGLSNGFISVTKDNIDQIGDLAGEMISSCPGDLNMIIGLEIPVGDTKDFDEFRRLTTLMFLNIYNDVVMGHLLDLHEGFPEGAAQVLSEELMAMLGRVKHMTASGIYPFANLVAQFSVNTFAVLGTLVYGTGQEVYDRTQLISFAFKPKA